MAGALRKLAGHEADGDSDIYSRVVLSPELARVERVMWDFVDLCNRLNSTRSGISGAGLRKALQATGEITSRSGSQSKCRLSMHEIDYFTSEGSRHRVVQREHPA